MSLFNELKRRNVFRVGIAYLAGAWLLIEVAGTLFPAFGIPDWGVRFVVIVVALGFLPALIISWAYELTPEGLKREKDVVRDASIVRLTAKRLDGITIGLIVVALAFLLADRFWMSPRHDEQLAAPTTVVTDIVQTQEPEPTDSQYPPNSIAVLPFINMSSHPEQEYFSDGISEELLNLLAKIPELRVISRSSSFAFKGEKIDIPTVAKKLNVAHVLEGSVRKAGNQVRITAQLIEARSDTHLWSETYDRELENIFAVQDEISTAIVGALKERLGLQLVVTPKVIAAANTEAYDAYLVGRAFVNARTPGWADNAIAAFEKAIRLDENYAPPYAGLAVALSINNPDWDTVRESAYRAAKTAIELDPELAEGHAALGLMLLIDTEHEGAERSLRLGDTQNDLERAERSLRRALELAPSLSIAYSWLSSVLAQQGRNEEANVVQEQGLLVDPLNPVLSANKADWLVTLGEHERAEQILLRLTDLPNPPWMAYSRLWRLYSDTGEFDKALHWAKEYTRANKFQSPRSNAAVAGRYEHLGLTEDADYWLANAVANSPQPESRFFFKSWQLKIRGDLAGIRAETDKLRIALGPDIDALHGIYAAQYASANILVGNFDVGIDVFETVFDFESLSIVDDMKGRWLWAFEFSHALAYAYQQVGRDDEANVLLTRLHERLNAYVIEDNMDFGPVHHLLAQNFGLRGDFDAAADALEAAIKVGWLRYIWVMNDPTWAQAIADPRIARMLDDVKVELERQRALVEQADAEHDFRAEFAAKRSTLDD